VIKKSKKNQFLFSFICFVFINVFFLVLAASNLKLQKETEHFLFYCTDQDVSCLEDFSQKLEVYYYRICNELGYSFKEKINVQIFPDLQTYHNKIRLPNAPDWVVGNGNLDGIKMTSPLHSGQLDYNSLLTVIVHEFTHVVIDNINLHIPIWVNEGMAVYEAGQMGEGQREFLATKIQANHIPKISDLQQMDSISFGNNGGYNWSYTIIEMVVKKYGWEKVREWVRNSGQIEPVFGISDNEFQDKWVAFLKKNYSKK
jgi:hypothetical protein